MAALIGIDLGTTKSAIAVWQDGEPRIIPDEQGRAIMPSLVAVDPSTQELVAGYAAQQIAESSPQQAIASIKRFMGRRYEEEAVQRALEEQHIFYEVQESRRHRGAIEAVVGQFRLTPQQVSAKVLQQLKRQAERALGHEITQAVITVPAYFLDSQRQATRDAGRIAGLVVQRVINEPTAACLAFSHDKRNEQRKLIAVYDLGGGTFDISILEVGGRRPFRVHATNGNRLLGGDDLDLLVAEWALDQLGAAEAGRLRGQPAALARLRAAARQAKVALSTSTQASLHVPGLLGDTDLQLELGRAQLEQIAQDFVERTFEPCRKALADAGFETGDIEEVLLVGGQTRMPAIRSAVQSFFGRKPNSSVAPEQVVALGAAVQAAMLAGETSGLKLADVVPLSLGVRKQGGLMDTLIERNSAVPISLTKEYSTTVDRQESVEVEVYQGEYPLVEQNEFLGSFILKGIELAPKGEPRIKLTFTVDDDGILHVTGEDARTGNARQLTITQSVRLSDQEVAAMVAEVSANAEHYEAQRRQAEQRVQAESLARSLEALLASQPAALPAELAQAIRAALTRTGEQPEARIATLGELLRQAQAALG